MSLSRTQSVRVAAVLEDCCDQLDILGHTLTVQMDRERGTAAALEKARLAKLRRDCQSISQQVSKLHLELEEKQSLSSLLQVVEDEEQKKKANNTRREEKINMEKQKETLLRQKEELKLKNEKRTELHWLAKDLNRQMDEQSFKTANKNKLMEKKMEMQLQQTQRETSETEKLLQDKLELLQDKVIKERRVHEEAKKFLQNRHKELQQQLQQWQQQTTQMLHETEQQLNSVCCKRTVNLDRLMEMKRMFREMEQVVKEDREEQEKLRQQQALAASATKLQAWWRGCMVRRGLGSFKKEEVKKGKKTKEGKKKKKK
ncbi:dynein regulatory complex protein 9 isoform X1 [Etheostoma spectabile]|uniref:dynein regulatory complex protein 9 isoform X1 n=1 Tax=Etheostoma spectabile TaxID=54343 RepID=UPI0013AF91D9|nr:dynein regulatory complex protein 9 isoform X1 [Etheostoma spectabile]XP_032373668.1 dynein regulatory complex protein 9 isoform X1 [Etheostoma spectabile]XP_032373669.1 dynein regulatory complex protein 9 isoform X1 [Etheostoma spectabile]